MVAIFAVMAVPWFVAPLLQPAPATDTHRARFERRGPAYVAPFQAGQIALRFAGAAPSPRARVDFLGPGGEPVAPPVGVTVYLEDRSASGERIVFRRAGDHLVSRGPVDAVGKQASLIVEEARRRHVYALGQTAASR